MRGTLNKTRCDRKGRLYLRESLRSRYGEYFFVLALPDRIILLPVPADPVRELRRIGRLLKGISIKALKKAIREQAEREADR